MKLLTEDIRQKLLRNGQTMKDFAGAAAEPDFYPVVKLFTPDAGCTWLLTEIDPDDHDLAMGLCDLGMGFPELGSVRISELETLTGPLCLPLERDIHFKAEKTISAYAEDARAAGRINA